MLLKNKKTVALLACLASFMLLPGCMNWEKKYQALNVEHQNTKGLLERERTEKEGLTQEVAQKQQTIDELQQKISTQKQSPGKATGFGEGYDVAFDATAGTVTVTLPNAILFDSGKAELKNATNKDLDHVLSVAKGQYAGRAIDVVGHTDSDPIKKSQWKDNWQLSSERALTVVRYMVSHGIDKDKIRAVGRGDSKPLASNSTSAGKAKNRRVDIVVHLK